MYNVLVASKSFGHGADPSYLAKLFENYAIEPVYSRLKDAQDMLPEVDAIIIGTEQVTEETFAKARNLKVVIKFGVGTDNIHKEAAQRYNVQVLNLPAINCETVAEMALGLILATARQIVRGDRLLRSGKSEHPVGMSVIGKTLGLIGTGAIGTNLANLVSGLGMKVIGYDIKPNDAFIDLNGTYVDFDDVLTQSDFISIHVPLNTQTYHLISAREFKLMKKTAILINTSRGPVVDESALYEAIKKKQIAGAGLDVFEKEPPLDSPLLELENVVCTPHIAAYADETLRRMERECVAKLSAALKRR